LCQGIAKVEKRIREEDGFREKVMELEKKLVQGRGAHLAFIGATVELFLGLAAMDGPAPWLKRSPSLPHLISPENLPCRGIFILPLCSPNIP
jgi:hypothetical protein